jgi:hypothetical protein
MLATPSRRTFTSKREAIVFTDPSLTLCMSACLPNNACDKRLFFTSRGTARVCLPHSQSPHHPFALTADASNSFVILVILDTTHTQYSKLLLATTQTPTLCHHSLAG